MKYKFLVTETRVREGWVEVERDDEDSARVIAEMWADADDEMRRVHFEKTRSIVNCRRLYDVPGGLVTEVNLSEVSGP